MDAVVLLGHGARDPQWARPMERLLESVRAREPALDVRLAFLEFMQPDLAAVLDQLAVGGARQIRVVPVFLAQGGHVKRDVPEVVAAACRRHPDISVEVAQALGESESVLAAMADEVLR